MTDPEFRPSSSDTNRLHRIRARLLALVPPDGTMSLADDVQRLDRALAAAEARGRQHGLLVAAWQAQGFAEAMVANGERGSSPLWWHITDLRRWAEEATDGR